MVDQHGRGRPQKTVKALLDIGTAKICCMVVAIDGQPGADMAAPLSPMAGHAGPDPLSRIQVLGFGHQRSRGIKSGVVINLDDAEQAIRAAVSQAERMAGIHVEDVVLAINCGRLKSLNFKAGVALDGRAASNGDITRIMNAGRAFGERDGRSLVHLNRIGFQLDSARQLSDPRGMAGLKLEADLHAVTADEAPLRNVLLAVERAYLSVSAIVAAPFAGALAVTTHEERRLGVTVIDLGAGTTSVALFSEGHFLHTDAIAVGAGHITYDIARSLSIPLAEAERIKTLYGSIYTAGSDGHAIIALAASEDGSAQQATKALLTATLRPRAEEMLRLLSERLAQSRLYQYAGGRVVLTGGGAQLPGIAELAANVFGRATRVGRPVPIGKIPSQLCTPVFSTVNGMARALFIPGACLRASGERDVLGSPSGYLERVGQWFKESF